MELFEGDNEEPWFVYIFRLYGDNYFTLSTGESKTDQCQKDGKKSKRSEAIVQKSV